MSLLQVDQLTTWFATDRGTLRAVDGVSLHLERGRTLGLVGESGSGKSVLTRSIMRIQPSETIARSAGRVLFDGQDLMSCSQTQLRAVWGRRIGLVPQNPSSSLNPVVRVGRQATEVLRYRFGFDRQQARARALELFEQVGIPAPERRLREYPHQLSGGMRQRVAIAIALAGEPDLLIADEPTTALDVTVQAQIIALLRRLQEEREMAMIFVSHDLAVVSELADEIAVMYAGRIVEQSGTRDILGAPRMPYTLALLGASPNLDHPRTERLKTIPGRPPDPVALPVGCSFEPRCTFATEQCVRERPGLDGLDGHVYACWHPLTADGVAADSASPTPSDDGR